MLKTPPSSVIPEARPVLILPKAEFLRLDDRQRRRAFTVAGVADVEALGKIFDLVMAAANRGIGWFLEELPPLYRRHGLEPTSEGRARRIHDTTLRQLYAEQRYRQVVDYPHGRRIQPYLRFNTFDDEKVRHRPGANHRVMHGKIFSIDHEIWRTWWYPAGHGCGCWVGIISAPEARRMGLTGPEPTGPWPTDPQTNEPALPDAGFRSAPLPWDPREWQGYRDSSSGRTP